MKQLIAIFTLIIITCLVAAFGIRPTQAKLNIAMRHYVGARLLALDTATYRNELGQAYTVTKFKYYIGKISLQQVGGGIVTTNGYYLVNEEEETTKDFTVSNIPEGQYTGISFIVGVDSADNCSGAQAGALDPLNGMFWAWNTGYIFLKLEGKSAASASPGHLFEYHIGGYKAPANCIRRVLLSFPQPLVIVAGESHDLSIKADAAEVLKTPNIIDIAKLPSVTDMRNAPTVADNYADMFSIISVH